MHKSLRFGQALAIVRYENEPGKPECPPELSSDFSSDDRAFLQDVRERWRTISAKETPHPFPASAKPAEINRFEDYMISTLVHFQEGQNQEFFRGIVGNYESFRTIAAIWRDFSIESMNLRKNE